MNVKKLFLSTLFVVMLVVPTVLGAVPLTLHTPMGTVSAEVLEAEARRRNTSNNRLRNLRVTNTGAESVQSFSPTRNTYRVNVRQSTGRADIVPTRQSGQGQSIRHRIDTRRADGTWRTGNNSAWRTGSSANNRIRVTVNQGQERRVRLQVRDSDGNIRNIRINVRRASGNTWGANLRSNAGYFNKRFIRTTTDYTLRLVRDRNNVRVSLNREHHNAQMRTRIRTQNANGTWGAWSAWTSYQRSNQSRNLTGLQIDRPVQVNFRIRGAFSNMSNTPTRTRTYTVTVTRTEHTPRQLEAVMLAEDWLSLEWGFSRQMLIEELIFDEFSRADATHAVDSLNIDWNAQAVLAANYWTQWERGISQLMLINLLRFYHGFTHEQAIHGASNARVDWNAQAVAAAGHILIQAPIICYFGLVGELEWMGFTYAQAVHAANAVGLTEPSFFSQVEAIEIGEIAENIEHTLKEEMEAKRQEAIRQMNGAP